jgi:hypothetical protein
MARSESIWWAVATMRCGFAVAAGIIGALLNFPHRALWIGLWCAKPLL